MFKTKIPKAYMRKGILKKSKLCSQKLLQRQFKKISFKPSFNDNRLPDYCHKFQLADNFWAEDEIFESTYCASESSPVKVHYLLTKARKNGVRYALRSKAGQVCDASQTITEDPSSDTDVWPYSKEHKSVVP